MGRCIFNIPGAPAKRGSGGRNFNAGAWPPQKRDFILCGLQGSVYRI